jgi:hypothetical protein
VLPRCSDCAANSGKYEVVLTTVVASAAISMQDQIGPLRNA